jgi:cysteinyl-tRNA synthetase
VRRAPFLTLLLLAACATARSARSLPAARSWAMQLQGIEKENAVDRLASAGKDLIVIEPTRTVKGLERFRTKDAVARIRQVAICLAYVNVGQAESYRTYWREDWRAPDAHGRHGMPEFLLTIDPDGWEDNYPVAYWDLSWRALLWGTPHALVDAAIADGFDGVYLDWILGYEDPSVAAAADRAGIDPARAMAELCRDLRAYARARRPGFLVVAQNGAGLPERVPEFLDWVDAVSQESLSFGGSASAAWDDRSAGDQPTSPELRALLTRRLRACRARGLPVFTVDYAVLPENRKTALERSAREGFVPFVSRSPLDRLP